EVPHTTNLAVIGRVVGEGLQVRPLILSVAISVAIASRGEPRSDVLRALILRLILVPARLAGGEQVDILATWTANSLRRLTALCHVDVVLLGGIDGRHVVVHSPHTHVDVILPGDEVRLSITAKL